MPSFSARSGRISFDGPTRPGAPAKPVVWASAKDAKVPAPDALAALERPDGPAYITLGAGDLAGFLAESFEKVLPQSAAGVQVSIGDDVVRVRAEVPLRELGGKALPEFVSDLLTGRDTVEMAGTIEMVHSGLAQFRVKALAVRGIDIPPRLVPKLLSALRRPLPERELAGRDSVASDAVLLPLPRTISDIRVSRGRVTLYKSVPSK